MDIRMEASWKKALSPEFEKLYFAQLISFVKKEYASQTVYPSGKHIFAAFDRTPFERVRVVILGQDPYHGPGQANGLCFSVNPGVALPPSLLNIFKEIQTDLGKPIPPNGDLGRWADQGVLLLNSTLTVRANQAGSHQKQGWEEFTDAAIAALAQRREGLVFLLWGAFAQKKAEIIRDLTRHCVLQAPHPSPLSASRGFFGCGHFSRANAYLASKGASPIDW